MSAYALLLEIRIRHVKKSTCNGRKSLPLHGYIPITDAIEKAAKILAKYNAVFRC